MVDGAAVFGFKGHQARVKQLVAGDDDDIEARRDVISTKNLSNQTLSAIPDNRSAKSLCRSDAEPSDSQSVRLGEQRVIAARNARPMLVDVLEIGVSSDPLARAELQSASRC